MKPVGAVRVGDSVALRAEFALEGEAPERVGSSMQIVVEPAR